MPKHFVAACALALAALQGHAQTPSAPGAVNASLESQVTAIAEELRCLVCQNETLAGSQSPLAVDLREQIRRQLQQGRTPAEIRGFMVARYGDFVLYRPRWQATTWLLWVGPFGLLLLGSFMVRSRLRATPMTQAPVLTAEDRQRARQLLANAGDPR